MLKYLKNKAAVTCVAALVSVPATAGTTFDFTDPATYSSISGSATGSGDFTITKDGISLRVSSSGSRTLTGFDGKNTPPLHVGANDGFGIGDDEITASSQWIRLDFLSGPVNLVGYAVLDLYQNAAAYDAQSSDRRELALATASNGEEFELFAIEKLGSNVFGGFNSLTLAGADVARGQGITSITFTAPVPPPGASSDLYKDDRSNDYALASITIASAVPEPASWLMLIAGFALVGQGVQRRRGVLLA